MTTLKDKIKTRLNELGADTNNFKFKYYKKSPYQKRRFKPEFVESECWIYPTNKTGLKAGYMLLESDFEQKQYSDEFLKMIIAETKN